MIPGLYDVKIEASFFRESESTQTTHSTLKNALVYRHNLNVSQRLFDEYPGFADGHACPDNFWTKENCPKGYWVPYHSSVNELPEHTVSRLAKQARLPGRWYSGCCRSTPLFTSQSEMLKVLGTGLRIAFLGDSFMRTNFQAFVDIAVNYTSPYPGIDHNWCGQNITDMEIGGRAKLSTFGEFDAKIGCWHGGANVTVRTDESDSILTYYSLLHSG